MRGALRGLAVAASTAALLGIAPLAPPPVAAGPVPVPTLATPPAGVRGHALFDSYYDLAPFGYVEEEFLVSGVAVDAGGATAPFTTRIIVARPADPAAFNGTVLLDWVNVTAQFENAVDTMLAREMLMREGFAYVHASVQAAGLCCIPLTPEGWDPVRYAAIDHPGDAFAFDIFSQLGRAFEAPPGPGSLDPMGDVGVARVERILAAGQSQSANWLSDYISEWLPTHPDAVGVIDGILVHGNVPGDKDFAVGSPVPVLHLLSDFEAVDDGVDPATVDPRYRLWEVAGAAHADHFIGYQSVFGHGPRVLASIPKQDAAAFRATIDGAGNYGEVLSPTLATCVVAGAAMPMRYATSAAIHQLDAWVAGQADPHNGPRFQFAGGALAADEHGNTLGGIRLPPMDVPVAQYASTLCQLGGITIPFTDVELLSLYGDHATYYARMGERSDEAVAAGWLLPEDAVDLMRRACAARIRFGLGAGPCPEYTPPPFDQPLARAPETPPTPAPEAAPAPATGSPRAVGGALPATGDALPAGPAAALVALALAVGALGRPRRSGARRLVGTRRYRLASMGSSEGWTCSRPSSLR